MEGCSSHLAPVGEGLLLEISRRSEQRDKDPARMPIVRYEKRDSVKITMLDQNPRNCSTSISSLAILALRFFLPIPHQAYDHRSQLPRHCTILTVHYNPSCISIEASKSWAGHI